MTLIDVLPHVTAGLNALAGLLILIGFALIKSGDRVAHKKVMTAAMVVSAVFLTVYLVHHALQPLHAFPGEGAIRPVYFTLLASHVILAVAVTPLIIVTFLRGRVALASGITVKHRALARWTLPLWLYVSVSGILVYWLLYHVYAA